jgi:hypothetical protein
MPAKSKSAKNSKASTRAVSAEIFKQVYDSPHSLPGRQKWITSDQDVRTIERLLDVPVKTIPLWISGDTRHCPNCGRETNWLDIISSAVVQVHAKELLIRVILGDKKFVNTEAPVQSLICSVTNARPRFATCAVSSVTTGLTPSRNCWTSLNK